MTKQIVMAAATALILFSACKKGDKTDVAPAPKNKKEMITAEAWNLGHTRTQTYLNDSLMHEEKETMQGKVHFMENNTVITYIQGEPNDTSAYSLNDNVLTIDSMPMDILELKDKALTLEFDEEETDPGFGTMRFVMTTYLTR